MENGQGGGGDYYQVMKARTTTGGGTDAKGNVEDDDDDDDSVRSWGQKKSHSVSKGKGAGVSVITTIALILGTMAMDVQGGGHKTE